MFNFLKSEKGKLLELAKNWLYLANKVYHFRRDELTASELGELRRLTDEVKVGMKSKNGDGVRLKSAVEGLSDHLRKIGGNYYPRSSMAENVEFFFVALIIYVGFTTFFIKPFKIPTNSMWPTYHGMTGEVYASDAERPSALARAARMVAFGATHYKVEAPIDGELLVPVKGMSDKGELFFDFRSAKSRRYFVLPAPGKEYPLLIANGGEVAEVSFKVPADFQVEREVAALLETVDKEHPFSMASLRDRYLAGRIVRRETRIVDADGRSRIVPMSFIRTGKSFKKGETIVSFDLMTGDQLFVDRMSYHFVEPKLGDGFVFRTRNIESLEGDSFYIKRLAGRPGDTVEVKGTTLYVNGEPATGAEAFDLNANQTGLYRGYVATDLLKNGPVSIPEGKFWAMGDNSHNSYDSRGWGYVPGEDVVGRPILIYYPFTKRFGLAK